MWEAIHPITYEPVTFYRMPKVGWVVSVGGVPVPQQFKLLHDAFNHLAEGVGKHGLIWIKTSAYSFRSSNRVWTITKLNRHQIPQKAYTLRRYSQRVFAYPEYQQAMDAAEKLHHMSPTRAADLPPFPLTPQAAAALTSQPHPYSRSTGLYLTKNEPTDQFLSSIDRSLQPDSTPEDEDEAA